MDKDVFISDQLETWHKCRRRYYFKYVKRLNWPEKSHDFELGKSVHALAQYHLRGHRTDHLTKNADPEVIEHWECIKNHPLLQKKLIAAEWGFNSRVGDSKYWLSGRIDAIFHDKTNNKYIIVDWKTGQNISKNAENSFQCKVYLYAFFRAKKDLKLDFVQDNLIFKFIKTPADDFTNEIMYSSEKEREFEETFLARIEEIETETDFKPPKECTFSNCQYKNLCK